MQMNRRRQRHFKDEGFCSLQFLKYAVCIFNTLFLLSGAAVLTVGLWTLIEKNTYISLLSVITYQAATYVLIGTGGLALFVGIVGCIGALRENRIALIVYTSFLLLIFLLEAACGVLAYMYAEVLQKQLEVYLGKTMLKTYKYDTTKSKAIDKLQQEFQCCGAKSYRDWTNSDWLKSVHTTNNTAPDSCCRSMTPGCAVRDHPSNIYHDGCIDSLYKHVRDHLMIMGAVGLGVCLLQIFGIVLSCCLSSKIKKWNKMRLRTNHATEFY